MGEALAQIRHGEKLDTVGLENGYESASGFREAFVRLFGRPPGKSRALHSVVVSWVESPLGPLLIGATDQGVCLVEFTSTNRIDMQLASLRTHFRSAVVPGSHEFLDQLKGELNEYFAGRLRRFQVPLVYPGTPFQVRVWQGLLRIPYGTAWSYEQLAHVVDAPGAQRAVGHANGQNRIAILIPCHRVVNKNGRLGGYGGGLWRKQFLLDLERGHKGGGSLF